MDFRVKDFKFRDITNFVNFGNIFFKFVTKITKIQKFGVQIGNFVLGLRISNFEILGLRISNFTKFQIFAKSPNFIQKILFIEIFSGFRLGRPSSVRRSAGSFCTSRSASSPDAAQLAWGFKNFSYKILAI